MRSWNSSDGSQSFGNYYLLFCYGNKPSIFVINVYVEDIFADAPQNISVSQVPYLYSRIDALHKQLLVTQQNFEQFAVQNQKELQASRQKFKELAAQVQTVIDELEKKTK